MRIKMGLNVKYNISIIIKSQNRNIFPISLKKKGGKADRAIVENLL